MLDRRRALGGFLPERRSNVAPLPMPPDKTYDVVRKGSGKQQVATTMALVRIMKELLRDKEIGKRIVPIIPDEARTFGMDSWFPSLKIYNRNGQLYTAVDAELMLAYKESEIGQILHEGINEAGSTASFTAVGTSYATHGEPMIPLYIFYSMFGFQRTGDGLWAAADQMARGFVLGATAGRTTLTGEGLQHADGHSLLLASTNPAAVAYDPAFSYEIAHIIKDGLRRMYGGTEGVDGFGGENIFYYITLYNEPYSQPAEPENLDVEGLLKGMYLFKKSEGSGPKAQILVSGVGMPEALRAQDLLADDWGVAADVSVRSRHCATRATMHHCPMSRRHSPMRPARSSPPRTGCAPSRTRSVSGSPARTPPWAPTGSASPTPVRPRVDSSTSTPNRSSSPSSARSPGKERSTGRRPSRLRRGTASTRSAPRRCPTPTPEARNPQIVPRLTAARVSVGHLGRR
jgi:homodimeric-type pyruvate dehydrogenase E1 component